MVLPLHSLSWACLLLAALLTQGGAPAPQPNQLVGADHNPQTDKLSSVCLSPDQQALLQALNAARTKHNLPPLQAGKSLTSVAQLHARDLHAHPPQAPCNMHSWSEDPQERWSACCYTDDHAQAACMWDKPREITHGAYPSAGYENSYWSSGGANPQDAVEAWLKSPGHRRTMLNGEGWRTPWKTVGIGIYGNYAVVWFGKQADSVGRARPCSHP